MTMVEVLVALTLLLILGGAGMAAWRQAARRQSVEAAADKVVAALRLAQANAAAGVKDAVGCGGSLLSGWQVVFTTTAFQVEGVCGAVTFASRQEAYSGGNVVSASPLPSPNPILFRVLNRGTNVVGTATITLTGFGISRQVAVTGAGEVR